MEKHKTEAKNIQVMTCPETRRTFFKKMAIGGAAMLFAPSFIHYTNAQQTNGNMLGLPGLLPVAVVEDCFDLAFAFPGMSNSCKIALAGDIDLKNPGNKGKLAHPLMLKQPDLIYALEKIKGALSNPQNNTYDKLSFLLGILCNNAIRDQMKPVYEKYAGELKALSIYQDVFLLKMLSGDEVNKVKGEDLSPLLKTLQSRAIVRVHTLIPDSRNGPGWVVNMSQWRRDNQLLKEKYVQVYTQPDPSLEDRYINDINFYNPQDSIIQYCRQTQNGEKLVGKQIKESVDAFSDKGSLYAKAVANGVRNILLVNEFLTSRIDKRTFLSEITL